jgi:dihydrofolate reductase
MRAGLLDELHVAVVPILLRGGERLLDRLDGAPEYTAVEVASSPAAAHVRLRRSPA